MATIQINGKWCIATLRDADYEGEYRWIASCGAVSQGAGGPSVGHLADAINDAEIHVDIRCDRIKEAS